jgi:hypothetical protein
MVNSEGRDVMPEQWTEREWSEYQLRRLGRRVGEERRRKKLRDRAFGLIGMTICGLAFWYLLIHVIVALLT